MFGRIHQAQDVREADAKLSKPFQSHHEGVLGGDVVHPRRFEFIGQVFVSKRGVRVKVEVLPGDLDLPADAKRHYSIADDTAPPHTLQDVLPLDILWGRVGVLSDNGVFVGPNSSGALHSNPEPSAIWLP